MGHVGRRDEAGLHEPAADAAGSGGRQDFHPLPQARAKAEPSSCCTAVARCTIWPGPPGASLVVLMAHQGRDAPGSQLVARAGRCADCSIGCEVRRRSKRSGVWQPTLRRARRPAGQFDACFTDGDAATFVQSSTDRGFDLLQALVFDLCPGCLLGQGRLLLIRVRVSRSRSSLRRPSGVGFASANARNTGQASASRSVSSGTRIRIMRWIPRPASGACTARSRSTSSSCMIRRSLRT